LAACRRIDVPEPMASPIVTEFYLGVLGEPLSFFGMFPVQSGDRGQVTLPDFAVSERPLHQLRMAGFGSVDGPLRVESGLRTARAQRL